MANSSDLAAYIAKKLAEEKSATEESKKIFNDIVMDNLKKRFCEDINAAVKSQYNAEKNSRMVNKFMELAHKITDKLKIQDGISLEAKEAENILYLAIMEAFKEIYVSDKKKPEEPLKIKSYKNADNHLFPLDKVNSAKDLWGLKNNSDGKDVLEFNTNNKSNPQAYTYCNLNFSNLPPETLKNLTPYDKRVHNVVGSIMAELNTNMMTLSQIHKAMGNTGRISKDQSERLNASLEKMAKIRITIDNKEEIKFYKDYDRFSVTENILTFKSVEGYKGKYLTEKVLVFADMPVLVRYAESHKQITKIPLEILQSPISQTEFNIAIEDYLLTSVIRIKEGRQKNCFIKWDTIYDNCDIDPDKKKQFNARGVVKKLLKYYLEQNWIDDYKTDTKGIYINPPKEIQ